MDRRDRVVQAVRQIMERGNMGIHSDYWELADVAIAAYEAEEPEVPAIVTEVTEAIYTAPNDSEEEARAALRVVINQMRSTGASRYIVNHYLCMHDHELDELMDVTHE